jgi:formamidopyrimidine-DNA glycosylase
MPELPEVETVVRQLNEKVAGKEIVKLNVLDDKIVDKNISKILPVKINEVTRRGKSIIFNLNNGLFLFAHLRMTGHFHFIGNRAHKSSKRVGSQYKKYLVTKLFFKDDSFLTHNSIRKFGSLKLLNQKQLNQKLSKLGPEPLGKDFTKELFHQTISSFPKANLKNKLLDQSLIAGIGNIYAQEAFYHAKIHPERKVGQVSKNKLFKLHNELQEILRLSIENNGATVQDYAHIDGKGEFQHLLAVYGKYRCPKKHSLSKINICGRGTYYCPSCQK